MLKIFTITGQYSCQPLKDFVNHMNIEPHARCIDTIVAFPEDFLSPQHNRSVSNSYKHSYFIQIEDIIDKYRNILIVIGLEYQTILSDYVTKKAYKNKAYMFYFDNLKGCVTRKSYTKQVASIKTNVNDKIHGIYINGDELTESIDINGEKVVCSICSDTNIVLRQVERLPDHKKPKIWFILADGMPATFFNRVTSLFGGIVVYCDMKNGSKVLNNKKQVKPLDIYYKYKPFSIKEFRIDKTLWNEINIEANKPGINTISSFSHNPRIIISSEVYNYCKRQSYKQVKYLLVNKTKTFNFSK
ncbi:hypothetical protein FRA_29c03440 [Francisella sp. W12-1067]|nr:hypothetical protein FRA_29c03440 [Francisella sp. W12-1067]